ncbi:MAG: hypothetical protein UGE37_06795 [Dialister hominis]|uniref:hypothetical protein n=1 Tax=Dialister hominis TaxID=2582419 RepID=UPI002EADE5A3|nr:hypothetical protein [Dialister hominis]
MGTETWIISLPLSDSILYLKIIHPPNFREEPNNILQRNLKLSCIEVQEQKKHWQRGKAEIDIPLAEEFPDGIHVLHLLSKQELVRWNL